MRELLLIIGMILTILLGIFLYPESCCQTDEAKTSVSQATDVKTSDASSWPFLVTEAANGFNAKSKEQFNFALNGSDVVTPVSPKLGHAVDRVVAYLNKHKDRMLTITGYHRSNEPTNGSWANLGLARADAVRRYLINRGVAPNQLGIAGSLDDSLTPTAQNVLLGPVKYGLAADPNMPSFEGMNLVDAETGLDLSLNDNFRFKPSGFEAFLPSLPGFDGWWKAIGNMFGRFDNKNLDITGLYRADEANPSAFPNLGLARANAVKRKLVGLGLPSNRINLFSEQVDGLKADSQGWLLGPIRYAISTLSADAAEANQARYADIAKSLRAEPLVLYFETGASQLNLTAEQRQKFMNLVNYLDHVQDAGALVVGHTDNVGNPEANMKLGQNRANFIKQYLIRNGLSANRIETQSKGQEQPIADNNTEEGRAENRRVVVTLKS